MHLFKEDWVEVHKEILKTWDIAETPQINVRPGDYSEEFLEKAKEFMNCDIIIRQHGYRSVHYLIEVSLEETKEKVYTEICEQHTEKSQHHIGVESHRPPQPLE